MTGVIVAVFVLLCWQYSYGFHNSRRPLSVPSARELVNNNSNSNSNSYSNSCSSQKNILHRLSNSYSSTQTLTTLKSTAIVSLIAENSDIKNTIAKLLGYVMGLGATAVYSPIIFTLLKAKSAEGFSVDTWKYSLVGLTLAILYPFKKKYLLSTYAELLCVLVQSIGIFGLISHYNQQMTSFFQFMFCYLAVCVPLILLPLSAKVLSTIQLIAILVCNYSNIPQILLTMRTKTTSWSGTSALLTTAGNFIRILTTLQLTKDPLILAGFLLGFVTNLTLFIQVLIYPKPAAVAAATGSN